MLASATEVEVELHVPDDVSTFFGVTWAQDPRKDKVRDASRMDMFVPTPTSRSIWLRAGTYIHTRY